jgi:N-acetylmuramoyl-L-alanine amidase
VITLKKLRPYTGDFVTRSPNHGARNAPVIQGIVLHATADEGDEALSLSWMRSPESRVSCHLLVSREGQVTRLVGDRQSACHADGASWRGTSDVNSVTLGIAIANRNDGEPYTDAQYGRVAEIVAHYCRQGLSLDDVVSHGEIAADRKTDPLGWDWDRFRAMVQHHLRAPGVHDAYDRRRAER